MRRTRSARPRPFVRLSLAILSALAAAHCDRSATDAPPSALALLRGTRWSFEEFCDCAVAHDGHCQRHLGNLVDDSALLRADVDSFAITLGGPGTLYEGRYFAWRARGRLTTTFYRHDGLSGRPSVDVAVDSGGAVPLFTTAGSDTLLLEGDPRVRLIRDAAAPFRLVPAPGSRSSICADRPDRPPVLQRR